LHAPRAVWPAPEGEDGGEEFFQFSLPFVVGGGTADPRKGMGRRGSGRFEALGAPPNV